MNELNEISHTLTLPQLAVKSVDSSKVCVWNCVYVSFEPYFYYFNRIFYEVLSMVDLTFSHFTIYIFTFLFHFFFCDFSHDFTFISWMYASSLRKTKSRCDFGKQAVEFFFSKQMSANKNYFTNLAQMRVWHKFRIIFDKSYANFVDFCEKNVDVRFLFHGMSRFCFYFYICNHQTNVKHFKSNPDFLLIEWWTF